MRVRTVVRGFGAGAVAVLLPLSVSIPPAAAEETIDSPFSVSVSAPTGYPTLSGAVDVVFSVTSDGVHAPATATVTLEDKNASAGDLRHSMTRTVELGPECAVACTQTVTIDTAAWVDPGEDPAAGDPTLDESDDQLATVVVSASPDQAVPSASAVSGPFVVDNHRHRLYWTGDGSGGDVPADDVLALSFYGEAPMRSTIAAELDHVTMSLPGHADVLAPVTMTGPADPSTGRWTAAVDTSALPDGRWTARMVGFDRRGVPTNMLRQDVIVDHGPQIAAELVAATTPVGQDLSTTAVAVTVKPSPNPLSIVDQVQVFLDGASTPLVDECWCAYGDTWLPSKTLPLGGQTVGGGQHTLHVHVIGHQLVKRYGTDRYDSLDWSGATDVALPVSPGPAVTATVTGPLVAHVSGTLTASLTAAAGTTLRSWSIDAPGYPVLASGDLCPLGTSCARTKTVSASLRSLEPGDVLVHVHAVDSTGTVTTVARAVRVDESTSTSLTGPTTVRYGGSFRLTGRVLTRLGYPIGGAMVTLQTLPKGSTAWSSVTRAPTSSAGYVTFTPIASRNAAWRLVTSAKVGSYAGSVSRSASVPVTAALSMGSLPTSVRHGSSLRVTARALPYESGLRLTFQIRVAGGSWRTVATPLVSTTGYASAWVAPSRSGTWYVRVIRPTTTRITAATVTRSFRAT